jgi:hypothetical protein
MSQSGALAVVASLVALGSGVALTSGAIAAPEAAPPVKSRTAAVVPKARAPLTVFLERTGRVVDHEGEDVAIPKFGGGDAAWKGIVGCVKTHFAPFQVEIVDAQPRGGDFITAVIGGRASQLGLDDRSTNGVGPYIPNRVQRDATVHVFSKVGTGERDIQNLCAVTVHEVAHAMGLDHTYKCGDIMSYYLDRCGPRKFLDVAAPCGEFSSRECGTGEKTQNSYRMLASLVGLKNEPAPEPEPAEDEIEDRDPWSADDDEPAHDDQPEEIDDEEPQPRTWRGRRNRGVQQDGVPQQQGEELVEDEDGNRYRVERVTRGKRTWVILRPVR